MKSVATVTFFLSLPFIVEASEMVKLKGYLGERLDAMIEKSVVRTDVDYLTVQFSADADTRQWWQTEFWGKWMHSSVPYASYVRSPRLNASIERSVSDIISYQRPSGYIGNYKDEARCDRGWDVWGMKYTMMGLMFYSDGAKDPEKKKKALDACCKLCDYVIGELGPNGRRKRNIWHTGSWSGMASCSILEPVVWLYRRTKEQKYLSFASYLVKCMTEEPDGPRLVDLALKKIPFAKRTGIGHNFTPGKDWDYLGKCGRAKAYEMMSCYQGLLEYAEEVKGCDNLREAALLTAKAIVKDEINLAGGATSLEQWHEGAKKQHLPYKHQQETCVTTTWMRFCQKLLEVTDDSQWADQIERSFYNAYLASLEADGSEFAAYTPLTGSRYHGHHHCRMHASCCDANGPRGFLCFLYDFFRVKNDVATFNFYSSALAKGKLSNGKNVSFEMYSLYPRNGYVRIVSRTALAGSFPMRLRIPAWCNSATVKLNGVSAGAAKSGTYFTIPSREWTHGDVVEIKFSMEVVSHIVDKHVAFTYGPVLLARDSRFGDGDIAEVMRCEFEDKGIVKSFTPVRTTGDDFWMLFSAVLPLGSHDENPEGQLPTAVTFCDYASAGNTWNRKDYYRTWFPLEQNDLF